MMSETTTGDKTKAEEVAGKYAWDYFQYHAGQRQSVFRFYLLLVGATTVGYAYAHAVPGIRSAFGVALMIWSFLFWRLDQRSLHLIKLAEATLKKTESRLSENLNDDSIRLMHLGDSTKTTKFPWSKVETFRQIYGWIFLLVSLAGIFMIHAYAGLTTAACLVLYLFIKWRNEFRNFSLFS